MPPAPRSPSGIPDRTGRTTSPARSATPFTAPPARWRASPTSASAATADVKSQANKLSHHPILEGKLACSSCHNPHGTLTSHLVKADDRQRALLRLPRRKARSVRLGAPAGRGELHELPHAARQPPGQAARAEGPQSLPGVPRLLAAPGHRLRRQDGLRRQRAVQPVLRPILLELPRTRSTAAGRRSNPDNGENAGNVWMR